MITEKDQLQARCCIGITRWDFAFCILHFVLHRPIGLSTFFISLLSMRLSLYFLGIKTALLLVLLPVAHSMRSSPQSASSNPKTLLNSDQLAPPISLPEPSSPSSSYASDVQQVKVTPKEQLSDADYNEASRRAFLFGGAAAAALCTCGICAVGSNGKQSMFANIMANGMQDYESLSEVVSFKSDLFSNNIQANDKVLEIGVGSGPNLKYYGSKASTISALEPNRAFDEFILESAATAKVSPNKMRIVPGYAEQIPMEDDSVDVVIGTMVLCSVQSVTKSLQEIYRVLKPGGKYIFTEHVAAPNNLPMLGMAQQLADPLQRIFAEGCHLRRNPQEDILGTFGTQNVELKTTVLSSGKRDAGRLPPHFLLSPHLIGCATKITT